jgi:hypothetical protein
MLCILYTVVLTNNSAQYILFYCNNIYITITTTCFVTFISTSRGYKVVGYVTLELPVDDTNVSKYIGFL